MLRLAAVTGAGLAGMLLLGCGEKEKEEEETPAAPTATVAPSGFFDSGGVRIHYETFGQGATPIILVHGFTSSLQGNWVAVEWVKTLQPIRKVVALDCRGHGKSDKPHEVEAYSGDNMAQDVLRLMEHLHIDKADLFGYSMGAGIAAYLLAYHPERFTSVIMGGIGSSLLGAGGSSRGNVISDALLAKDKSEITDPIGLGVRVFAESNPENDLVALAACASREREPVAAAEFADVEIPVLIVNGEEDTLVGSADELANAIPGAKLTIIPERDHLTVVPDQRFKDAVLQFLGES
jgi:pimeloyl-ACP methyl ester carboxylesterase